MKRYIFALIAPVLLLASCEVNQGETHEPMDVGEYIARHTTSLYVGILQDFFDYAVIADWYLSTNDEALKEEIHNRFMPYYAIVMEDNIVRFQYSYNWDNNPRTFREYVTDGKLLREGGKWKIVGSEQTLVEIEATDGVYGFTASTLAYESAFTISSLECDKDTGIDYVVEGWLNSNYNGYDYRDVLITSEITAPLEYGASNYYRSHLLSGSIAILCEDKRINSRDEVKVTINAANYAEVEYLGERATIEY